MADQHSQTESPASTAPVPGNRPKPKILPTGFDITHLRQDDDQEHYVQSWSFTTWEQFEFFVLEWPELAFKAVRRMNEKISAYLEECVYSKELRLLQEDIKCGNTSNPIQEGGNDTKQAELERQIVQVRATEEALQAAFVEMSRTDNPRNYDEETGISDGIVQTLGMRLNCKDDEIRYWKDLAQKRDENNSRNFLALQAKDALIKQLQESESSLRAKQEAMQVVERESKELKSKQASLLAREERHQSKVKKLNALENCRMQELKDLETREKALRPREEVIHVREEELKHWANAIGTEERNFQIPSQLSHVQSKEICACGQIRALAGRLMNHKTEQLQAKDRRVQAMFELVQVKEATIRAKEKEVQDLKRQLDLVHLNVPVSQYGTADLVRNLVAGEKRKRLE